ncbi:unnamed protein product [Arabis nemorensis]|uniref:Uncharacterized protein n=1 Tax=Arabis nemorensis TaxID=586526 RepID=A0A565BJP6_9BRAS|nr:unnamed protein product [Arabis nemorensis]
MSARLALRKNSSIQFRLANRSIISGFPSKDSYWIDYFFYVPITEASVGPRWINKIVRKWRRKVINPFPKVPPDFLTLAELLASERCNWQEDFSPQRIEDARARYFVGSDSSNTSSQATMEKRPSVRERKEAEARRLAGESEGGVQNMEVDVAAAPCPGRRSESSAGNRPGRRSESPAGNRHGRRSLSIASLTTEMLPK